jgi:hypothetical protein
MQQTRWVRGRPRRKPHGVFADRGDDFGEYRRLFRAFGLGEDGAVSTAAEFALGKVSRVRDDPDARLALMCRSTRGSRLAGLRLSHPRSADPRVRITGIFLSISRILPDAYPLGDDVERYVGHRAPVGPAPRRRRDPAPPAAGLRLVGRRAWPARRDLLAGDVPCYAWPADDRQPWFPRPTVLVRMARHAVRPGFQPISE